MTDVHPATGRELVPAVGGQRRVPAPDPIAREYVLLVLRLDQHVPGLVDGYFGPAELKAQVDMENLRPPARLAEDAAALRARLEADVPGEDRRAWLDVQLVALETHARALAGDALPYLEHVVHCFAHRPIRRPDSLYAAAAAELETLVPGEGPLVDRLAADDDRWIVPVDRARPVVDRLLEQFRGRAAELFGLPEGESLTVSFVRDQPWSGYNHFDGGRRSRIDLNTDLPLRVPALATVVAHETYPGHHLEAATKEARLVDELGRLEASVLAINTPQNLLAEGLADLGRRFAIAEGEEADLLVELATLAGIPLAEDRAALREAAERRVAMNGPRRALDASRGDAALLLHADGASRDEVVAYLVEVGRFAPATAAKRLEFLEHPLWRTYVFVYHEGETLLRAWLELVPERDRAARFGRLLREPLTPPQLRADIAAATG